MNWRKEILLLGAIFILMALGVHPDLLSDPIERFNALISQGAYWHPLLFSLALYLILVFIRYTLYILRKTIQKFTTK